MQLLIKQRVFSWTDTYDVYDEKEEPKYFVKAEFFALGHQIHVYDKSGREVGMVKQRLLTLLPAFDIEIDGKEFGSVQKEFSFFKPRYELDYNGWRCEGDFLAWDYDDHLFVQFAASMAIASISAIISSFGSRISIT